MGCPCYLQLTDTDTYISSRGVAEHSHRSQLATDIVNNMKADIVNFLEVPPSHEVLIMQGSLTQRPCSSWK
jgi:phosphoserine aminotransferase